MQQKFIRCLIAAAGALLLTATNGFSWGSLGTAVNTACSPAVPYTGNCNLCHVADRGTPTPAWDATNAGGTTLTDFFCPPAPPTCTDRDNDTYAVEGGDCGPVDCNDADASINPGATENCSDKLDNNCNGLVDAQDPAAVGCLVCTDSDGDGFAVEGGACGQIDCNDKVAAINPNAADIPNNGIDEDCSGADSVDPTAFDGDGDGYTLAAGDCNDADASINPGVFDIPNNGIDENCDGVDSLDTTSMDNDGDGFTPAAGDCDDTNGNIHPNAVELCTDAIDNDCNGLIDNQDQNAVDCPVNCTDNDGDKYATEGGECGPVDCNDSDPAIHPGANEICADGVDNDCDGSIDEGCDVACPDADGDGYQDAACGGNDCNDNVATINPGTAEICGNAVDENCNGTSDDVCLTCPDGSVLVIRTMNYDRDGRILVIKGRATEGTTVSIIDTDTGATLAEGIEVSKGLWSTRIEGVGRTVRSISATSSNGCTLEQTIGRGNRNDEDDDDDGGKHPKKNPSDD
jgi:hypothetical protein